MALALGKMMEGDNFSDSEEIVQAVGITYYFICRAIQEDNIPNPYIYVYKFSTEYEYNKAMYRLMAHAEGREYRNNPFDMFSQISIMTYDHNLEGMMMADVFTEPQIPYLDTGALYPCVFNSCWDVTNGKLNCKEIYFTEESSGDDECYYNSQGKWDVKSSKIVKLQKMFDASNKWESQIASLKLSKFN